MGFLLKLAPSISVLLTLYWLSWDIDFLRSHCEVNHMAFTAVYKKKNLNGFQVTTLDRSSVIRVGKILFILGLFIGAVSSLGNMPLGYKFGGKLAQSLNDFSDPVLLGWYFSITAAIPLGFLAGKTTSKVFKELAMANLAKGPNTSIRGRKKIYLREGVFLGLAMLSALPFVYITHHALKPLIGSYAMIIDIPAFIAPTAVNRWALLSVVKEMSSITSKSILLKLLSSNLIEPMKIFGCIGFLNGALSAYQYWGNGKAAAEWMHLGSFGICTIGFAALICNGALGAYTGKVVFEECYSWLNKKYNYFRKLLKDKNSKASRLSKPNMRKLGKIMLIIGIIVVSVSAATPNVYLTLEQISKHTAVLKYGLLFCSFVAPLATNFYSIYHTFYTSK
jgi:hypothetical protein